MYTVEIEILRPIQSAVGMKEVEIRAEKIGKMTAKELERHLRKHVAPIVIGPGGMPYLLDHQHLARTLLQAHAGETLYAEVKENWSKVSKPEFWARMKGRGWVYLHDETGKLLPDPTGLPKPKTCPDTSLPPTERAADQRRRTVVAARRDNSRLVV
jgi:hypothetical protein